MFVPKIIKPCRLRSHSPILKKARAISNYSKGIETSLILDLNILSKMNEVETEKIHYKQSGLNNLVKFLNHTPFLCPTPGFAVQEVDKFNFRRIIKSFESFLEKYCPLYDDHPHATKGFIEIENKSNIFRELPISEKYFNSVAYLAILKIQIIERIKQPTNPQEKFKQYMEYMISTANIIGAIITLQAQRYKFSCSRYMFRAVNYFFSLTVITVIN